MAGLIAMQKVEGSNTFSRFFGNPLHLGLSALAGKSNRGHFGRFHLASASGGATVAEPIQRLSRERIPVDAAALGDSEVRLVV
jgi:hypothetical protein